MSMFDYFRSSYNLGEQFTNTICQTKTIEEDYGGTLTEYWLDPSGVLWYGDYEGTSTCEEIVESDLRYDAKAPWNNFRNISTGQHGKFKVHPISKSIEIYPANWKGKWEDWPRMLLEFENGVLKSYGDITFRKLWL